MTDASNVATGGMGRRISEVGDLIDTMTIIDPSATVDFVGKLAHENDWTYEYAAQVYAEYRRFLLMAWMSPTMVVPSDHVDQAWHLHLTHTRHYWDVLCGEILKKPLHHDPSLGTGDDVGRHEDHYVSTLSLYRYLFDEEAPSDIWPRPCSLCRTASKEVVVASGASATGTAIGIAAGLTALLFGHPLIGIACLCVGTFLLVRTIADATRSAPEARHAKTYAAPRSRSYPSSRSGSTRYGSSSRSTASDTSGSDAALAFTSWVDPTPATASHASPSHGHSSHSCSSHSGHSSHSCGGSSGGHSCSSGSSSSCGSSCGGGGGCGGGGD